ncbi:type II CAAX endopeptidase family protein [Pontibacter saemangeumensis]|uniref:Type II CAAX endopeptidase family protein n=1 Tax=Pontibacter saemangeumensis TaxID=1084525 RepID=A0ABP8LXC0_9BACT
MSSRIDQHRLFIPLALLLSWGPWVVALLSQKGFDAGVVKGLLLLGLLGPAVSAWLLLRNKPDRVKRIFLNRIIDFRLISVRGYLFIVLVPVMLPLLSVLVSTLAGYSFHQLQLSEEATRSAPYFFTFLAYTLLVGPLPEEIGWRGYLLESLRNDFSGLQSSFIIALVWGIWHVPLFFVEGYPLQGFIASPLLLFTFFGNLFPLSILYTWLYYANRRSILAAILFHFMINYAGTIIRISPFTELVQFIWLLVIALFLVLQNKRIFLLRI